MKSIHLISGKTWLFIAMIAVILFYSLGTLIGLIIGVFKFVMYTFIDIMLAIVNVFAGMIVNADRAFGDYVSGPLGAMGYIVIAVALIVICKKLYKNSKFNTNKH